MLSWERSYVGPSFSRCSMSLTHGLASEMDSLLANARSQIRKIRVIFTHLKLWVAVARHNFKWVKILIAKNCTSRVESKNVESANQHEALSHCWFDAGPPSTTLAQHQSNSGSTSRVRRVRKMKPTRSQQIKLETDYSQLFIIPAAC